MKAVTSISIAIFLRLAVAQVSGGLPPLPDCVNATNANLIISGDCGGVLNDVSCTCNKAYNLIESEVESGCNTADAQTATNALNAYCGFNGCDTVHPAIGELPPCALDCAQPIIRNACGGAYDNYRCNCDNRPSIDACIQTKCSASEQQQAYCTEDAWCNLA